MRSGLAAVLRRACRCASGVRAGAVLRAVHGQGHPRRGPAAHRARHRLQLPAGQGRRDDDRGEGARRRCARSYATGFFPGRAPRGRERRAGRLVQERPAIAADRLLRHEGIRARSRAEGAARDRPRRGAHLRPLGARHTPSRRSSASTCRAACTPPRCRPRSRRSSATASASTSRSPKARSRRSAASTSSATRSSARTSCSSQFVLRTPGWLTWYTKHDQYSREKLSGGPRDAALVLPEPRLSRLQHRVHAGLDHARTGEDIYITVNVTEGEQYTVSDVQARGADCSCRARSCAKLVQLKPGDVFSREKLAATTKAISDRLGNDGYAFANVNADPERRQGKAHRRLQHRHRPGPPRVRAAHRRRRQHQDARRGDAPRDAPARGRVLRRLEDPALAPAHRPHAATSPR